LLLLLAVLPLAGCKGFNTPFGPTGGDERDPIFNDDRPIGTRAAPPPQPPQPVASSQGSGTTATPAQWIPPTTGTTTPAPAALVSSGSRTTDTRDDPRARGPQGGATSDASGWQPVPVGGGGAQLSGVQVVGDRGAITPAPLTDPGRVTQAGGVQRVETLEQAFAVLKGYGMDWFQSKQVGQNGAECVFECTRPGDKPNTCDHYTGRGVDQLAAMRAVIDEMVRKQAGK
jgi:hypothetical protein